MASRFITASSRITSDEDRCTSRCSSIGSTTSIDSGSGSSTSGGGGDSKGLDPTIGNVGGVRGREVNRTVRCFLAFIIVGSLIGIK